MTIYCILCCKLVLRPPRGSSSAETIVLFWAEVDVKEQLSPLSEPFTSFWKRENAQSGVVYRTRTVLRILLHDELFRFEGRVVELPASQILKSLNLKGDRGWVFRELTRVGNIVSAQRHYGVNILERLVFERHETIRHRSDLPPVRPTKDDEVSVGSFIGCRVVGWSSVNGPKLFSLMLRRRSKPISVIRSGNGNESYGWWTSLSSFLARCPFLF